MPYCLKDTDLEQYINKYNSCLKSENGDASLKRKHAYYYQTQQQIFTAGKPYCDFVVCAFKEQIDLFCKRICLMSATGTLLFPNLLTSGDTVCYQKYWEGGILKRSSPDPSSACFCRLATGGTNQACHISTFHLSCLKITKVPCKWFCPLCQENTNSQK